MANIKTLSAALAGKNLKRRGCLHGSGSLASSCADSHCTYAHSTFNLKKFQTWSFSIVVIADYEHFSLPKKCSALRPARRGGAVLHIGFETCANLLLRRHYYYSGIQAVLASLASSNIETSCLIHVAPVLFFYGGGEGLHAYSTFKTSNSGHFPS